MLVTLHHFLHIIICPFFRIIKTSHSYLADVTAAELQLHLSVWIRFIGSNSCFDKIVNICNRYVTCRALVTPTCGMFIVSYFHDSISLTEFYYCAVLWCAQIIKCIMAWWSYSLFAHYTTSLSSLCRRIWRYCTSKLHVKYSFVEYVSKIKSVLSIIFLAIYGAVCIQLTHFTYDDYENTCTSSNYHHQIGSMTHLALFRVRSWNNGMHCMPFYILTEHSRLIMHNVFNQCPCKLGHYWFS